MPVIALGSLRSCGVTTTALALATAWPKDRSAMLVECDPAGGTLIATLGLAPEPGIVSLAAAARRPLPPHALLDHAQPLTGNSSVVVAPPSADHTRGALSHLGDQLSALGELEHDVLVDCGRLDPGSPALAVFAQAAIPLLVIRPALPDLHTVATSFERAAGPFASVRTIGLVLIGASSYSDREIKEALSTEIMASLPHDPQSATRIGHAAASHSTLARTPLVRSTCTLANALVDRLDHQDDPPQHAVMSTTSPWTVSDE